MSPCGGECRVGRTLPRGPVVAGAHRRRRGAESAAPIRGADPRRRQHRPFATNKRSTSAAARRPPAAAQSAAQAAGAARAPRRSISHAHRSPQARAGQSERCHKPPQRSCLNRGAVPHHPLARAASAAPSRARTRGFGAIEVYAALTVLQIFRSLFDDPVADCCPAPPAPRRPHHHRSPRTPELHRRPGRDHRRLVGGTHVAVECVSVLS